MWTSQEAIELRDTLEEMLRGHLDLSRHQRFYVNPGDQANLMPDEVKMMQLFSGLQDAARAHTKNRRTPQRIGVR
jgi:hypothetical protein